MGVTGDRGGDRHPLTRPHPQREEGMIQGQLNHSDAAQYIRQLKDHIDELKAEVRHPWVLGDPRLHPWVVGDPRLHPWVQGD